MSRLEKIGEPEYPLSMSLVLSHLRIEPDAVGEETELLSRYIEAALDYCGGFTRRQIPLQKFRLTLDSAGSCIELPHPPAASVESVTDAGGLIDPSMYILRTDLWPPALELLTPPSGQVVIEYTAGYTEATLPSQIRQAALLIIGQSYDIRQETVTGTSATRVPMSAESLLWMQRMGL